MELLLLQGYFMRKLWGLYILFVANGLDNGDEMKYGFQFASMGLLVLFFPCVVFVAVMRRSSCWSTSIIISSVPYPPLKNPPPTVIAVSLRMVWVIYICDYYPDCWDGIQVVSYGETYICFM